MSDSAPELDFEREYIEMSMDMERIYIVLITKTQILVKLSSDAKAVTLIGCELSHKHNMILEIENFFKSNFKFCMGDKWAVIHNEFKSRGKGLIKEQFLLYRVSDDHILSIEKVMEDEGYVIYPYLEEELYGPKCSNVLNRFLKKADDVVRKIADIKL
jgi:hypothetical protein